MSRGKILVVEDERDIREGLCELLVRDGYDVTACGSVQEAERSIAGGGADEIQKVALSEGMTTLRIGAAKLVLQGVTSIAEVERIATE